MLQAYGLRPWEIDRLRQDEFDALCADVDRQLAEQKKETGRG